MAGALRGARGREEDEGGLQDEYSLDEGIERSEEAPVMRSARPFLFIARAVLSG